MNPNLNESSDLDSEYESVESNSSASDSEDKRISAKSDVPNSSRQVPAAQEHPGEVASTSSIVHSFERPSTGVLYQPQKLGFMDLPAPIIPPIYSPTRHSGRNRKCYTNSVGFSFYLRLI